MSIPAPISQMPQQLQQANPQAIPQQLPKPKDYFDEKSDPKRLSDFETYGYNRSIQEVKVKIQDSEEDRADRYNQKYGRTKPTKERIMKSCLMDRE